VCGILAKGEFLVPDRTRDLKELEREIRCTLDMRIYSPPRRL